MWTSVGLLGFRALGVGLLLLLLLLLLLMMMMTMKPPVVGWLDGVGDRGDCQSMYLSSRGTVIANEHAALERYRVTYMHTYARDHTPYVNTQPHEHM